MKSRNIAISHQIAGISFVEILSSVLILVILSSIGMYAVSGHDEQLRQFKLETQVSSLNAAVMSYEMAGGVLGTAETTDEVLAKLKSFAHGDQKASVAGASESFINSRLTAVPMTAEEAASSMLRVMWDPVMRRFVTATSGANGVSDFVLGDSTVIEDPDARNLAVEFAALDKWVWDYKKGHSPIPASPPPVVPLPANEIADASGPSQLSPPVFSLSGGDYPLADFHLPLTLIDPNSGGSSEMMYSIDGGPAQVYAGGVISVHPNATVYAYASSLDPVAWVNSDSVQASYHKATEEPAPRSELALAVPNNPTYVELGGAMIPGSVPGPAPTTTGPVTLVNAADFSSSVQDLLSTRWTYDGSNPVSSATAQIAAPTSGGFVSVPVDFSLPRWGSGATLQIKVAARSADTFQIGDSEVVVETLTANPMTLRAPQLIELPGGMVEINLDSDAGDTPEGARIYYTTDGTDPGDDGTGDPLTGTLYTSPVNMPPQQICVANGITARVYGPSGYERWFTPSPAGSLVQPSLASISEEYAFLCDYKDSRLGGYTWLVLGDANFPGTTEQLNGSVAIGPGAHLDVSNTNGTPSNITVDPTATMGGNGGAAANPVTADLSQAAADALALNLAAGNLESAQNFGTVQSSTVISSSFPGGGINVISIDKLKMTKASSTLTIQGGPEDYFIFNIATVLQLSADLPLVFEGVDPSRVLLNILPGGDVNISGPSWVMGTSILAPAVNVSVTGGVSITGSVISGGTVTKISGSGTLNASSAFGNDDDCCGDPGDPNGPGAADAGDDE